MCLAAIAINQHPNYKLVCIANRDEFHNRPSQPMHWWSENDILAGADLQANGTWMGITKQGRFALVTNVRNPDLHPAQDAPSRGHLVTWSLTIFATGVYLAKKKGSTWPRITSSRVI